MRKFYILFALILFAGNHPEKVQPFSALIIQANAIVPAKDSPTVKYWSITEFRSMMKDASGKKLKLKERKKLLKQQTTAIRNSSGSDTSKALLIGANTTAARFVAAITNPTLQPRTGNLLYTDNMTAVLRADDQAEDYKIVLNF